MCGSVLDFRSSLNTDTEPSFRRDCLLCAVCKVQVFTNQVHQMIESFIFYSVKFTPT